MENDIEEILGVKKDTSIQDKLDELITIAKDIKLPTYPEPPTQIEIKNFPKNDPIVIPPAVVNTPKEISLDFPWWLDIPSIKSYIKSILDLITSHIFKVEVTNKVDPVIIQQVRIVDESGTPVSINPIVNIPEIKLPTYPQFPSGKVMGGFPEKLTVKGINPEKENIVIDDVSTANITYVGKAPIGSSQSSAGWQIMKMDESGTPTTLAITWADGNANYDNVWDNRTSLTYL